jgi:hypothetical protein
MKKQLTFFVSVAFLVGQSSVALGFHDGMPKDVYAGIQEYGVTFIEYDGPVVKKDGCPNVRRTLLKSGPLGRSLGMALFAGTTKAISHLFGGLQTFGRLRPAIFPTSTKGNRPARSQMGFSFPGLV